MIFDKKIKSTKEKLFPFESLNNSVLKYIPAAMIIYYNIWGNKYFKILMLLDEYGIIDTKKAFNYITKRITKELKTHVIDKNDINDRINQLIKQYAAKENKQDEKITIDIE